MGERPTLGSGWGKESLSMYTGQGCEEKTQLGVGEHTLLGEAWRKDKERPIQPPGLAVKKGQICTEALGEWRGRHTLGGRGGTKMHTLRGRTQRRACTEGCDKRRGHGWRGWDEGRETCWEAGRGETQTVWGGKRAWRKRGGSTSARVRPVLVCQPKPGGSSAIANAWLERESSGKPQLGAGPCVGTHLHGCERGARPLCVPGRMQRSGPL